MQKNFFITTPIYYANGPAHIGHAYSSFLADIIAREKRLLGYNVKFSTGLDENGQKMIEKANREGLTVMEFLDNIASIHLQTWKLLKISYTDFIRTTQKNHHDYVKKIIQKVFNNGDFYEKNYDGLYCVGCESFKKESDLSQDGLCPDHQSKPIKIFEKNYFFRLSKYENELKKFYLNNPHFVYPDFRFNEIKKFVENGLEDFSASRKGNDFRIKFPYGEDQVVYIWFDALFNYLTVCQDGNEDFWPADLHIMAKDIVKFHAIYWPAMLMSVGYELPKRIFCTGYFTVDGQKMSKTIGNVLNPVEIVNKYGRDALVFYLFYDVIVGNDGDFNWDRFHGVFNSMLVGGWGNFVVRVTKLSEKNKIDLVNISENQIDSLFVLAKEIGINNNRLLIMFKDGFNVNDFEMYFENAQINLLLKDWYELVQLGNKFIDKNEPWKKLKDENSVNEGLLDLQLLLYLVKNLSLLSASFLIDSFEKIQSIFDCEKFNSITSNNSNDDFINFFNEKSFKLNLKPQLIYTKID